jgi:hypothetical protein
MEARGVGRFSISHCSDISPIDQLEKYLELDRHVELIHGQFRLNGRSSEFLEPFCQACIICPHTFVDTTGRIILIRMVL